MATIVAAAGGGNWNATGTWVGAVVPTAADDVQLDATSGNVTINVNSACRSLDCTGYTGTLTHSAAVTLSIGDATAGAGNVALKLVAGMTYTLGNATTSSFSFVSTSTTQQTVDAAGKTCGGVTFNGVGGSWKLTGTMKAGTGAVLTLTRGTLNTDGQTLDIGGFNSSNSNTRTLTLGASAISLLNDWNTGTATNLTVTSNTATVTLTGSSVTFSNGSINWNGLSVVFNGAGDAQWSGSSSTVANLTRTGTAVKTCGIYFNASTTIVTGTLTLDGNSATNRLLVYSSADGTARTLNAATVSASNVDFRDITAAGAGNWNLSAITGNSGDAGGNSGITFTTAATQTWSGTSGGNWSANAWTSRVPLPQDDVVISSAFTASQTVTMDMPRAGKSLDASSCTGNPTLAVGATNAVIYGSLTMGTGMTATSSGGSFVMSGRGSYSVVSAGVKLFSAFSVTGVGLSVSLDDACTFGSLSFPSGTLTANADVTASTFSTLASATLNMGSVTWTVNGAGSNTWNTNAGTINCGTSTIKISNANSINLGTGKTYYAFEWSGAVTGAMSFNGGSTTFSSMKMTCTKAFTISLAFGATYTVNGPGVFKGASGQNLTLSQGSSIATIVVNSLDTEYLTLSNVKINQKVLATGLASTLAFGSATVSRPVSQTIDATGIASGEAFGSAVVAFGIFPSGLPSEETFGSASVTTTATVTATGLASGETFGSAAATAKATVDATGIASEAALGEPGVAPVVTATGIASAEAVGSAAVTATATISTDGIASGEAFGDTSVAIPIIPVGIASEESFGSPGVSSVVSASSLDSTEAFGSVAVTATASVTADGIASGVSFGDATVTASASITATAVDPTSTVGTPGLVYNQTVDASGITSGEAVGSLSVTARATVAASALAPTVAFGSLTATTVAYVQGSGFGGAGVGVPAVSRIVLVGAPSGSLEFSEATSSSLVLAEAQSSSLSLTPIV